MDILTLSRVLRELRRMGRREHWDRAELDTYRTQALGRLRGYACERSPFYRRFHHGLRNVPLHELPVLTKAMMVEHFDELLTDRSIRLDEVRAFASQTAPVGLYLGRYRVNATSGSSGRPGFFLFDDTEWSTIMASFARGQVWSGTKVDLTHRQRMATVASTSPWHVSSQVALTAKSWWRPSLRLAASQPLAQIVQQLNGWRPEVLVTYASMAGILAQEQLAGRLSIHPAVVYTSSEVLTPQTRGSAKRAWGNEPFNQYGATETAEIAAEHRACRCMHLFEDLVIAEVVDEHNRPVPAGTYGAKLLVTTLFSRTQPLIRYEVNDSVRLNARPHGCGLPFAVMESIQGRTEDTLLIPSTSGGRVAVRPLVFNRVMDIAPVGAWQLIQQEDDGLVLLLAGSRNGLSDASLAGHISASLAREGAVVPYVRVQHVDAIPKTPAGKAPLIRGRPWDGRSDGHVA